MPSFEELGVVPGCCTITGALTGLGVGIWAAVEYVQPALADVDGISKVGADWITAGISLFGGLEVTTGAGACAGLIVGGVLLCAASTTYQCVTACCDREPAEPTVSHNRNSMFNRDTESGLSPAHFKNDGASFALN